MRNILLVARQEFMTNIRKRSFLFAVFGVPLLMAVIFAVVFFVQIQAIEGGIVADEIGYVDQANIIASDFADDNEMFIRYQNVDAATVDLDQEAIDTFFVLPALYLASGDVRLYSYGSVSDETRDAIEVFIVENLTSAIETDAPPERMIDPINFAMFIENTGRELTLNGIIGLFLTPLLFAVVLMLALQLSSTFLMAGVVEEKQNHIMEILITSITPYELLTGKLLGLGALGLIQMLVWIVVGLVGVTLGGDVDVLSGIALPLDFLFFVLLFFVLTYFLYASLLAGIGAVIGSEQESRTIAGIVMLPAAIPLFFVSLLIMNPESPIFSVLMMVPFTAGMTYMLKFPFAPIPLWQVAMSLGLLVATTLLTLWASAKVFRWGLLLYGKKPNLRTIWQVISGRQEIGVMVTTESEMERSA